MGGVKTRNEEIRERFADAEHAMRKVWGHLGDGAPILLERVDASLDDLAHLLAENERQAERIAELEQALEDQPPDADAALLASANRALMERVERLERVLAAEQGRDGLPGWDWTGDHEDAWWERQIDTVCLRAYRGGSWYAQETAGLDEWLDDEDGACDEPWSAHGYEGDALEAMERCQEAAEAALRGGA